MLNKDYQKAIVKEETDEICCIAAGLASVSSDGCLHERYLSEKLDKLELHILALKGLLRED